MSILYKILIENIQYHNYYMTFILFYGCLLLLITHSFFREFCQKEESACR